MPSERYFRWQASPSEEDQEGFPELEEEFQVECDVDDAGSSGHMNGGRVRTVLGPRQGGGRFGRRVFRYTEVSFKTICLMAVVCMLCVSVGLLLGYVSAGHKGPRYPPYHRLETIELTDALRRFGGRDFTAATAVHLQSFLTSRMVNVYAIRLNRIPESQVADHVASTLSNQGYFIRSESFAVTLSTPDSNNPNTVVVLHADGSSTNINQLQLVDGSLPFAAYSPAGEAHGPVIYGHTGSDVNLATLRDMGIDLKDSILLLRHSSDSEAAQIARAEAAGAVGVLFYPDPEQFAGNGTQYPNGTGLPDDGVLFPNLKLVPGDPSTVHYPSLGHVYKKPPSNFGGMVPAIPVQPISYYAARGLLVALAGPKMPIEWRAVYDIAIGNDTVKTRARLSTHNIGSRNSSEAVNVRIQVHNLLRERIITNVHAWLPAQDTSRVVHIGASQGSVGGAGVGMASLLALGESLARAFPNGTGRRIMLNAWADSHRGWLGSTEFTELHQSWLEQSALAYLDIGSSVGAAQGLRVQASPLLHEAIREASHHVSWPQQEALSVIEGWRMEGGMEYDIAFENLGCSSDAISFSAGLGVPSVQFTVARPAHPAECREGECSTCYDRREEHPLAHSQYDTTEAARELLDPSLDWTTAMASLVGVTALVLSESVLPPVDFKGDLSGSLVDGWWSFLHHHLTSLNHTQYNFTQIVDAIRVELYDVQEQMEELTAWYDRPFVEDDPYQLFRHDEERVNCFMSLSRRLLGPRGVGRVFTTSLAGPPTLLEDPSHATHPAELEDVDAEEEATRSPEDEVPSNVLAIQTSKYFSESPYNNLAFSSSYREETKPRPHSWFPHVSQALTRALANNSSWEDVHRELSLLLSALTSFESLIPVHI